MLSRNSRSLCTFYFTSVVPNDVSKNGEWICKKCGKTKFKSGGWTNLLNHLRSCIGWWSLQCWRHYDRIHPDKAQITSLVLQVSDVEHDMYKWMEWVVMKNLPSSPCSRSFQAHHFKVVAQTYSFIMWRHEGRYQKQASEQVCNHLRWLDWRYYTLNWDKWCLLFIACRGRRRCGPSHPALDAPTNNWQSYWDDSTWSLTAIIRQEWQQCHLSRRWQQLPG